MMFQLALALGKTVRELEHEMDSRELSEWIAYTNLEPLPDPWIIGGQQCALMYNLWTTGKKRTYQDWVPSSKRTRQSGKQVMAALSMFAARHNARIEHEKRKDTNGGPK